MQKIIKDNLTQIQELCLKYDVKTMYLIGSACTNEFNQDSDIDILIEFKDLSIEQYTDSYFELHYDLEDLFSRKVDLVTNKSITNPYLKQSIEETKELLFAA